MKTVIILEDFEGYPNGKKRAFAAGSEEDLADTFADLVVDKGHARLKSAGQPAVAATRPATKPGDKEDKS